MEGVFVCRETQDIDEMKKISEKPNNEGRTNVFGMTGNRKGVALVMALIMVTISAAILGVVAYFALTGSETSALQRRYESAKEATIGAFEITAKDLFPLVEAGQNQSGQTATEILSSSYFTWGDNNVTLNASNECFYSKIMKKTSEWSGCSGSDRRAAVNPDMTFLFRRVAGETPIQVDLKIIDTITGDTEKSGVSLEGSGVTEKSGITSGASEPYLYTMELEGKRQGSTAERVQLEILYAR